MRSLLHRSEKHESKFHPEREGEMQTCGCRKQKCPELKEGSSTKEYAILVHRFRRSGIDDPSVGRAAGKR